MSDQDTPETKQERREEPQNKPCKTPVEVALVKQRFNNVVAVLALVVSVVYAGVTYSIFSQNATHFEIVNRPNLAIGRIGVSQRNLGLPIHFDFEILNLGDHPVHIYKYKTYFDFDTVHLEEVVRKMKDSDRLDMNAFVVPRYPLNLVSMISDSLTNEL